MEYFEGGAGGGIGGGRGYCGVERDGDVDMIGRKGVRCGEWGQGGVLGGEGDMGSAILCGCSQVGLWSLVLLLVDMTDLKVWMEADSWSGVQGHVFALGGVVGGGGVDGVLVIWRAVSEGLFQVVGAVGTINLRDICRCN
ncbi:hypothetical protein Tco_1575815 [Tanacetum coccineum]